MRSVPPTPSTTTTSHLNGTATGMHWNSPIPYLFGGLAFMLLLIAVALVILACSYRKSSGGDDNGDEEKSSSESITKQVIDNEPKIVVIMAGDANPTFLAKPVPRLPPLLASPPSKIIDGTTCGTVDGDDDAV